MEGVEEAERGAVSGWGGDESSAIVSLEEC